MALRFLRGRLRRRAAAGVALALASMLAAPAYAAPSTAALTGVVTLDGEAVEGADVVLTVLRGLDAPAERHQQTPAMIVQTGVDGRFVLPLQLSEQVLDIAAQNGAYVNYMVQAFYTDTVQPAVGAEPPAEPTGLAYSAADLVYSQVIGMGLTEPAEELAGYALSVPDPVTLELTVVSAVDTVGEVGSGSYDSTCQPRYAPYVTVIGRESNMTPVGEAHANYDMVAKWDYGEHANTDLTGAFSYGGGAWKVSASASHIGNRRTMTGASYGPFQSYIGQTLFRYRKEKVEFTDDAGDGRVCRIDYRIIPEGWSGTTWTNGPSVRSKDSYGQMDAARGKGWASVYGKGAYWTKSTARGYKYRAGVDAFGVGLTAQSTWSNQVDIYYKFGSATSEHWLYGSNAPIPNATNVYAW